MDFAKIKELDAESGMQNYGRNDVAFVSGKGPFLYDTEGKEYIDFGSGIGVVSLGYGNPHWVDAVSRQAATLSHVSNLFYTEPYAVLASRLTKLAGMKAAFFGNSGAEANEGAIKLARKYSFEKYGKGRHTIVTLLQSFHGRTMAALTATGQPSYHDYFFPFVEGFRYVPANDSDELKAALTDDVCAVMVEGIQGEGGVIPLSQTYVDELARLTSQKDILLIFDEVQTGNGRTGTMFSYQGFSVEPDVVTTAKGLGGGLPIGAILVNEKCKNVLSQGMHGSTFGGNPIVCAGANAVLDVVSQPEFLAGVAQKGDRIKEIILGWQLPAIKEVRGKGLMLGIVLDGLSPKKVAADVLKRGLVILTAGSDALRLLPPLTIGKEEIEKGLEILRCQLTLFTQ
ncbi:MAG: aspartate aminotransferase family protein [Eubacteriales bacterium]|nr:aspartate aminotransferase family protein [Eubacteriales bacterium]MDD3350446.1 aspartate aminotransferase family protein [Eubacteriales bacterium]